MDVTIVHQYDALYSILLIVVVIAVLIVFSASLHTAIDNLVLLPLDFVFCKLKRSAVEMLKNISALQGQVDFFHYFL
jgi:hypothetical protein